MKKINAFTITQLLVVLASGAILTAALAPAISNNHKKAKSLTCQANLKQIGFAAMMYSNDFDSCIPSGTDRYVKSLIELFLPDCEIDGSGMVVDPETGKKVKAFKCPAYPVEESILDYVHNGWNLPNTNINGSSSYPESSKEQKGPAKLNQFVRLSETIYMADNEYFTPSPGRRYPVTLIGPDPDSGQVEYRWCDVFRPSHLPDDEPFDTDSKMSRGTGRRMAKNRHDNGSNALYADWHVGRVKTSDMLKPGYNGYQSSQGNAAGIDMWRFWK